MDGLWMGGSFEADRRNILSLKFKTGQMYFSALLLRYFFDIQFHLESWFCLSQNWADEPTASQIEAWKEPKVESGGKQDCKCQIEKRPN